MGSAWRFGSAGPPRSEVGIAAPTLVGYRAGPGGSIVSGMSVAAVPVERGLVPAWLVDLVLLLVGVASTAVAVSDGIERGLGTVALLAEAILGALSCAGILVRGRWPVGFAVVVGIFSVYALSASLVSFIALFTVAAHRRFAVVAPVVAGYALVSPLSALVRPDMAVAGSSQVVLGIVCVAAVLAWGMYTRARHQLLASLRERAYRAEAEQELRVAQARQLERARIAREMHDVLAHRISLLSLHAGALELRPTAPPQTIASAAGVIRESAHQVLEDLREVIGVLRIDRPDQLPERPQPGLGDLGTLIEESRRAGCEVSLRYEVADPDAVPATVGRAAYRIAQEGLTNARKHAPGQPVTATIRGAAGDGLTVELHNSVAGDDVPATIPGAGIGLIGLAERVAIAGGRFEPGPAAGGFQLRAWLPWPS